MGWPWWCTAVKPQLPRKWRSIGSWFEVNQGEKLVRAYLKEETGYGGKTL
jgi:hypothetical protein